MERGSSERLCWGGGELQRGWFLRAGLRAAVGRGLVWVRGRRRSCAAVSPGEVFLVVPELQFVGMALCGASAASELRATPGPIVHGSQQEYPPCRRLGH